MRSPLAQSALVALFLLVGWPDPAGACSCMRSGPPCEAFWRAAEVLDATVVDVQPPAVPARPGGPPLFMTDTVVTLDVHRSYKSPMRGPLQITTGPTGGGCGYPFEPGRRYLIFANPGGDGRLSASRCSASREYDGRGPDAEFLGSLDAPPSGGRVFGTVETTTSPLSGGPTEHVALATTVTLSGAGGARSARSSGGRYEFAGLLPGTYQLEAEVPAGYGPAPATRSVEIANPRGCAEADFSFAPAGTITGRLIDQESRPIANVTVEVAPPDTAPMYTRRSARTDADGHFALESLPPGRYIVGVNLIDVPSTFMPYARAVYPGSGMDPHVIELTLGQTVDLGSWHVPPPLAAVRVAGIVVRPDGTPVPKAFVSAADVTGRSVGQARGVGGTVSDADGRFVLELRQGRTYLLNARGSQGERIRTPGPRIDTSAGDLPPVRIVLLD